MQDTTLTMLDQYCERAGHAGPMAEPINAITNIVFMIAAYMAYRALKRRPDTSFREVGDLWALVATLFCIGVGSTLWHVLATPSMLLADVLPITFFINIFMLSSLRRLFGFGWDITFGCWGVYIFATYAAQAYLPPDTFNGTIMYVPSYLTLFLLMLGLRFKRSGASVIFARVLFVWTLSLTLRTIDQTVCPSFPLGTHFMWHLLNAYVVYQLLLTLIRRA